MVHISLWLSCQHRDSLFTLRVVNQSFWFCTWYDILCSRIQSGSVIARYFFALEIEKLRKAMLNKRLKRERKRRKENRTIQTWEVKQRKWITRKQGLGKWTLFREKTRPVFEKMFTRSNFCAHGYIQSRCKGDLTFAAHHCTERSLSQYKVRLLSFKLS